MISKEELLAKANMPAEEALRLHTFYNGKVQIVPKCRVQNLKDFSIWYTPGVAAPCQAISKDPELVYQHTNKANTIAIISDGTRVLGLGDIGPKAGLPVMEGKALLFKYLGGVDAIPICLDTKDPDEIVRVAKVLEPSFGGINLEDIAQPKCFRILDQLRERASIPVWHDDQQGSATVLLAGLINALKILGKEMSAVRIAMIGMGAANVATYRLLKACGADLDRIVACDSKGILHKNRKDIEGRQAEFGDKWMVCQETNGENEQGGMADALQGADVCVGFAGGNIIQQAWVAQMAKNSVVFACANPVPEIWPWEAKEAGVRIVSTGRSDFPNQVNNSLFFPAVFRGALDIRARTITDEMAIAGAYELARFAEKRGMTDDNILPTMEEWEVYPQLAAVVAMKAQEQGITKLKKSWDQLHTGAVEKIQEARRVTEVLMEEKIIADAR